MTTRLYRCENCGKTEPWGKTWAWYGSYRQLDYLGRKGVKPVQTICSSECRIALVAGGKLPADGLDDMGDVIEAQANDAAY